MAIQLDTLPDIRHPYYDRTLKETVQFALDHAETCMTPAPDTLEEVREVYRSLIRRAPFNWVTGQVSLDVLNAAIDHVDLTASSVLHA